jgi:hypothetical protein
MDGSAIGSILPVLCKLITAFRTVAKRKMSEECSAAIANGLEKQNDPGCPTIPCSVGSFNFEKALCDLGASVSVMPRDVFEKLRLPMEPTGICLELGDNSNRYPLGIAEDVPVKVGHHFIRRLRCARDGREGEAAAHPREAFPQHRGSYY